MDVDMTDQQEPLLLNGEDGAAAMEVAVVAENGEVTQPVKQEDPLSGEYTWKLEKFSSYATNTKQLSPVFEVGGYPWQMLCFPRGNNKADQTALYLAVAITDDLPWNWQRSASFKFTMLNHLHPEQSVVKETKHTFCQQETDWGFTAFALATDVLDPSRGFCVHDTVHFKVEVSVTMPEDLQVYDSRKETGFVGLKNQGATCYMNSLLQTLYNLNQFRRAVYHMPTSEDEEVAASMPLALQSVFYKLQFLSGPVSTKDLTSSFGWDTTDAFQQHDVQELNRILCDRLEEKMKGTRVEGTVNALFEGHTHNYIDCIDIDYRSTRREAFQDLQLDVKGCATIYDSFDRYTEVETLEGDNAYEAEGHGKQAARKGVVFDELPPVLQLHLKRFEYDYTKDVMVKINDRYEFFGDLDLDNPPPREGAAPRKYLSDKADRGVKNRYRLHSVLVHSGGVHGGHYYAYIRPNGKDWLRFDDDRVERADSQRAVDDNWGGDDEKAPPGGGFGNPPPLRLGRYANAYMLVYVRESEWDSVMCEVTVDDISEHVRARLKVESEEKERKRKEKAEAHLFTLVRVATDEDLKAQIGASRFFDLVDFERVGLTLKLPKKAPFADVQRMVAERLGVAPEAQRYWRWADRQNKTYRPSQVLEVEGPEQSIASVGTARHGGGRVQHKPGEMVKLNLYLETPPPATNQFIPVSKTSTLLFFKHFIPGDATTPPRLEFAGRGIFANTTKIVDLYPLLAKKGGLPEGCPLEAFEEVKPEPTVMIEPLQKGCTLTSAQLEHGDIIVFQRRLAPAEAKAAQYRTADEFLRHVRNRVAVSFRPLAGGEEGVVALDLLKDMRYDAVSAALAKALGLDHPLKVRLTAQSPYSRLPRPQPLKYGAGDWALEDMLRGSATAMMHQQVPEAVLFYEVIDLPLPELERLVTHRVAFHNARHEESTSVTVRLPRDKQVGDLLEALRAQLPQEAHGGAPLRLMEVYHWRIWQLFNPADQLDRVLDTTQNLWHLRAEVVPPDQRELDAPGALHVHCLQVHDKEGGAPDKHEAFPFSDPFIMALGPDETVAQLKARVQAEMGVPDEEFAAWKVVLISGMTMSMDVLDDDVVVAQRFNSLDDLAAPKLYTHHERQMLGFHHENKNPRRTHLHIHRPPPVGLAQERQLRIKA